MPPVKFGFYNSPLKARSLKRRELVVFGVVDEDIAVGQRQDARTAIIAGAVPARRPELPTDLKRHDGFAATRRHRQKNPRAALSDRLDRAVDGGFLVIAGGLGTEVVGGRQEGFGGVGGQGVAGAEAAPEFGGRGEWSSSRSIPVV